MDVNMESLANAILDVLSENPEGYDIDIILKTAEKCWDDTAVKVKNNDFMMIFDLRSYELQDYQGYDGG